MTIIPLLKFKLLRTKRMIVMVAGVPDETHTSQLKCKIVKKN